MLAFVVFFVVTLLLDKKYKNRKGTLPIFWEQIAPKIEGLLLVAHNTPSRTTSSKPLLPSAVTT